MMDELPSFAPMRTITLPCGGSVLACKAVVKDSWLQWSDVLPAEDNEWSLTNVAVGVNVINLARELSNFHKAMKNYKQCDASPFTVTRWWDPTADDGWETGRFCLFKFKGLTATELVDLIPRKSGLILKPVSPKAPQWVEASASLPLLDYLETMPQLAVSL